MTDRHTIKPTHKAIKDYNAALAAYADQSVSHEGAVRSAFQNLLAAAAHPLGWTLIPELSDASPREGKAATIRPDGTFRDEFYIERGYCEAKDSADDLDIEIKNKIAKGYRLTNTIFEDTARARPYQDGRPAGDYDLTKPQHLADPGERLPLPHRAGPRQLRKGHR